MASSSRCRILQDPDRPRPLEARHFDPEYWRGQPGTEPVGGGRGGSLFIRLDGRTAILRPYYRGGAIGRLLKDQYLWFGLGLSRPWREWQILQRARRAGLPVPDAVGACVCRYGFWYRAVLITAFIDDTEMLTARLRRERLQHKDWARLGRLIKRLQAEGIRHADLTSDNLLIDSQNRFYVIDFDRARIMNRLDDWQWLTLYRFRRSMLKRDRKQRLNFSEDDWQAFMDSYES